jgi:hypothetical protein
VEVRAFGNFLLILKCHSCTCHSFSVGCNLTRIHSGRSFDTFVYRHGRVANGALSSQKVVRVMTLWVSLTACIVGVLNDV